LSYSNDWGHKNLNYRTKKKKSGNNTRKAMNRFSVKKEKKNSCTRDITHKQGK
jgi:hypothetical protein